LSGYTDLFKNAIHKKNGLNRPTVFYHECFSFQNKKIILIVLEDKVKKW